MTGESIDISLLSVASCTAQALQYACHTCRTRIQLEKENSSTHERLLVYRAREQVAAAQRAVEAATLELVKAQKEVRRSAPGACAQHMRVAVQVILEELELVE